MLELLSGNKQYYIGQVVSPNILEVAFIADSAIADAGIEITNDEAECLANKLTCAKCREQQWGSIYSLYIGKLSDTKTAMDAADCTLQNWGEMFFSEFEPH